MVLVDDVELLLGKLDEMKELGRIVGVEEELQQFRGVVQSAGQVWATGDYISLGQLGGINERADALLEKIWRWHERHRGSGASSSSVVKVAGVVARFCNKIKFRPTIASEVRKLISEYQCSALPRAPYNIQAHGTVSRTALKLVKTDDIIDRDEDMERIIRQVDQLRQQAGEDGHKLHIIPIVGLPGIGKTTVAQMVYDHPWVQRNFDLRIWVDVSPYFDHERVLRRMADFLLGANSFDEDSVHFLKESLKDKRYLLVLDDVWNEDQSKWDALKQQLLDISAAPGARGTVIVTTSIHGAAEMMMMAADPLPPYELQGLSAAGCLRLFYQSLHKKARIPSPQRKDDEEVHKFIQERCCGLPVAVLDYLVTGLTIPPAKTVSWGHLEACNSVSLRYELLPIYLRHCFQFCSLFPEDHSYDKEELGEIWLAQRWNEAPAAAMSLLHPELTCYAELWKDCFFQNSTDKVTYKMHYLMRRYAEHLKSLSYTRGRDSFEMMRMDTLVYPLDNPHAWLHLSLLVDSETSAFPKASTSLKNLKTLILIRETPMVLLNHKCKISRIEPQLFARMKYISVLDLQYTMIKKLSRTVGNLLNLRYLNLSGTDITTLPRCIGKLRSLMFLKLVNCVYLRRLNEDVAGLIHLQKLDIASCISLVRVPNRIDNMKQLRCMNIKDCSSMVQMPYSLGQFTKLHTLPRYIVGDNDGCTIKELQTLGLEGELCVENLQKVTRGNDAATAELWKKTMLKSLTLQWKWWKHAEEARDTEAIQEVLEELQPNKNLIKLEIISYMGKQFPSWMSGMPPYLASLKEIKLFNLQRCQALPPLGVLPRLKVAEISGMDAITNVDNEFYGANGTFPSLQKLTFSQMLKLEKWLDVKRRNMFPCLTNLTIINCPKLVALEMELPSVTELALWLNNEGLYSSNGDLRGLTGSLKKLSISLCEKLLESSECEGLKELRTLEELEISGCQGLTSLPRGFAHLNSITSLTILRCNRLMALPNWSNDELTSLRSLSISGCNLLRTIPAELRGRRHLRISVEACPMLA